jgi:hypothetical protein
VVNLELSTNFEPVKTLASFVTAAKADLKA